MKRLVILLLTLITAIGTAFVLVSCADKDFDLPTNAEFSEDFSTFEKVNNGDAYALFSEVYSNYIKDSFKSVSYFEFNAKAINFNVASQQNKTIKKFDGDKYYSEAVTVGTGKGEAHIAKKFYYNSDKAYEINVDDKGIVPGKGKGDELFKVNDYGNFTPYSGTAEELKEKMRLSRERMTFYNTSKKEYLSDEHDNNIYTRDNKLYITLTLDCSREAMRSFNKASMDEFVRALGIKSGDEDTFNMLANSTIKIIIGKINGINKMLGFQLAESYEGKASGVTAKAHQTNSTMFYYDSESFRITDNDIANLQ